jgi:hypothetical protein
MFFTRNSAVFLQGYEVMKYAQAKKLHNGDEVIAKDNRESIKVLSICTPVITSEWVSRLHPNTPKPVVFIEGLGSISGHGGWFHTEVK